jgi:hypothetical protein
LRQPKISISSLLSRFIRPLFSFFSHNQKGAFSSTRLFCSIDEGGAHILVLLRFFGIDCFGGVDEEIVFRGDYYRCFLFFAFLVLCILIFLSLF